MSLLLTSPSTLHGCQGSLVGQRSSEPCASGSPGRRLAAPRDFVPRWSPSVSEAELRPSPVLIHCTRASRACDSPVSGAGRGRPSPSLAPHTRAGGRTDRELDASCRARAGRRGSQCERRDVRGKASQLRRERRTDPRRRPPARPLGLDERRIRADIGGPCPRGVTDHEASPGCCRSSRRDVGWSGTGPSIGIAAATSPAPPPAARSSLVGRVLRGLLHSSGEVKHRGCWSVCPARPRAVDNFTGVLPGTMSCAAGDNVMCCQGQCHVLTHDLVDRRPADVGGLLYPHTFFR